MFGAAARYLGLLGPKAKDAVAALADTANRRFDLLPHLEDDPRVSAIKSLGRIGPAALPAIPALIRAVKTNAREEDPDCQVAAAAARVLGFFGAEASAAVPVLIDAAQAAKEGVREEAIIALGRIGPEAKAAIPVLQRLMDDFEKGSDYVPEALFALYRLAPDGKRLAEKWLAKSGRNANGSTSALEPKDRVALLGLMGQTSVEGDWWTRCQLVVARARALAR